MGVTVGGKHQLKAEGKSGGTLRGSSSTHRGGRVRKDRRTGQDGRRAREAVLSGGSWHLLLSHPLPQGRLAHEAGGTLEGRDREMGGGCHVPPDSMPRSPRPLGDTELGILAYSQGKTRPTIARRGSPQSQQPGHPGHPGLRKPHPGRERRARVTGGGREMCHLLGSRDSFCEQAGFLDAGVTVMVMMVVVG